MSRPTAPPVFRVPHMSLGTPSTSVPQVTQVLIPRGAIPAPMPVSSTVLSSSDSVPDPDEDILNLRPRQERLFNVVPEGILFPTRIVLPSPTAPTANIQQAAIQLGLNLPRSLTRAAFVSRMENLLRETLGYHDDSAPGQVLGQTVLARERPIRVISADAVSAVRRSAPVSLASFVPNTVFSTKESIMTFIRNSNLQPYIRSGQGRLKGDLARDLRQFLAEHHYAITPTGDFVREGSLEIEGGLEYQDLIQPEHYYQFLMRTEPVPITQEDLVKLQMSFQEMVPLLSRRRWLTLNGFVGDLATRMEINPGLAMLISLLARIHHLTATEVQSILTQINDNTVYRTNGDRMKALMKYIRTRLQVISRNYSTRVPDDLPAPVNATLDEIIENGYELDVEHFGWELSGSQRMELAPSQLRFLANLYLRHPELYKVAQEYSARLSITNQIINLYYDEEPTYPQTVYTFAVNYPIIIPESEEKRQRRAQIAALPTRYLEALFGIYGNRRIEHILDKSINPLELFVYALPKIRHEDLGEVVRRFGMLIPEHLLRSEVRDFVVSNMGQYRDVITRKENVPLIDQAFKKQPANFRDFLDKLKVYSDFEIIEYFGYVGGFDNREALVDNIYRTIIDEGFMMFNEIDANRATNAETLMMTNISDLPKPYIAFGTPFQYRVLELDEMISGFQDGTFRKIGASDGEVYTNSQIGRLQMLLPLMRNSNLQLSTAVEQVLKVVQAGLVASMRRSAEVDHFIRSLDNVTPDEYQLIKNIFYKVFYAGMYMRRWRGPGNRYPVQGSDTRVKLDPKPAVTLALGELYNMTKDVPEIVDLYRLTEIDYNASADEVLFQESKIFEFVDIVTRGEHCIRLASRRFVITAYYYIGVVFGESIPDFSPYDVEKIS